MGSPDMTKPASGLSAEPVSKIEQVGTELVPSNNPSPDRLQAQTRWLTRRFVLSAPLAAALACLVFGEVRT
jgi:hypothetical protein